MTVTAPIFTKLNTSLTTFVNNTFDENTSNDPVTDTGSWTGLSSCKVLLFMCKEGLITTVQENFPTYQQ
jgi:hypothetical protein